MLFAISVDALCYNEPTPLKMLLAMLKQIYANHSVRHASALHSAQRRCYTTVCGWCVSIGQNRSWLAGMSALAGAAAGAVSAIHAMAEPPPRAETRANPKNMAGPGRRPGIKIARRSSYYAYAIAYQLHLVGRTANAEGSHRCDRRQIR